MTVRTTETTLPEGVAAYERDLALFSDSNDEIAAEAFDRLWSRVARSLTGSLALGGMRPDDVDDHLQSVRIRLWERRTAMRIASPGAWWILVRTVSRNLAIDRSRSPHATRWQGLEDPAEIPERDMPYIDALVVASQDLRRLYGAADRLWLGGDGEIGDEAILAAQLVLLDGVERPVAASLLSVAPERIDRWLEDSAVLRRLAYRELFWTNDALAGYVLRPEAPYTPEQLDELLKRAREGEEGGIEGWAWKEVLAVLLRIRNGLLSEQILRFERVGMKGEQLERVIREAQDRFPFEALARRLRESTGTEALAEGGLWRRLVFQYHTSSELPHRQIHERTAPAAEVVGVKMTEAMLNNWLGLGRLWSQLAAFVAQEETP